MFQSTFVLSIFGIVMCLIVTPELNAQSGSRNNPSSVGTGASGTRIGASGRTGRRGRASRSVRSGFSALSPEELRLEAERRVELEKAKKVQLLTQLSLNRNSKYNRKLGVLAYRSAKEEYSALRQKKITPALASRVLPQTFLLTMMEVNRMAAKVHWPKALLEEQHSMLIREIDERIEAKETNADEFMELFAKLSRQLGERAVNRTITQQDYAKAKRFLSGLANETRIDG